MNAVNYPRIDPFTAEAERATVEAYPVEDFEALRAAIAALAAQRDNYYGECSQLRRELRELREFVRSISASVDQ